MEEKLEVLVSEKEDLIDQLEKQESVMKAFRRSLDQIKMQNCQYKKTINFHQQEILSQQKIVKQTSGQLKKQEFANRLLMVEIQCLKGQLSELDNDYKSLGRMTSLDEPDSTEGIDLSNADAAKLVDGNGSLEISDFVHNGAELQLKNTDSESEEEILMKEMMQSVAALQVDVKEAELARDRMRAESRAAKIHAERFNAIFCHAIFPCDPDVKNDEHAPHKNLDLDRLLLGICLKLHLFKISNKNWNACSQIENMGQFPQKVFDVQKKIFKLFKNCKLQCELNNELCKTKPTSKHDAKWLNLALAIRQNNSASRRSGLVTCKQVEKSLRMMQKEPSVASKCHKYLQNTLLMLAESLEIKQKELQLQEDIKSTMEHKLQHLLSHSNLLQTNLCDLGSREDEKISNMTFMESSNLIKEDVEVEFEQPPLSITNHNFRLDEYCSLKQEDLNRCDGDEQDKKC